MKSHLWLVFILFFLVSDKSRGQHLIKLANPSFEDEPRSSTMPTGWYYYGHPDESPPDIQPGFFEVTNRASDGKTYLGLVVRDNSTWEGIGQDLPQPLKKGYLYEMSVALALPNEMFSISRMTGREAPFHHPVLFRIWGVDVEKNKEEILAETPPINHTDWKTYHFSLLPRKHDYPAIAFTAWYVDGEKKPYNGYILIDNCSALKVITP
ncbi:MAG: hypothetical protein JNJ90_06570 [Saprospiraceae bacterium]|jgi:hypothetical protein|nr:hypothetical protein [Saprospiraceae bacterium]